MATALAHRLAELTLLCVRRKEAQRETPGLELQEAAEWADFREQKWQARRTPELEAECERMFLRLMGKAIPAQGVLFGGLA